MRFALKNTPIQNAVTGNGIAETPEELMCALKSIRGWMLSESDWTQAVDSPLAEDVKQAWREWRQELRDITKLVNVDNVQDWFEITDPPQIGLPATWLNWRYETFSQFIAEQKQQFEQSQHHDHGHTH
jgi:hypothetical protein